MESRNSRQANDWAAKRKAQLERASRLRAERQAMKAGREAEDGFAAAEQESNGRTASAGRRAPFMGARGSSQPSSDHHNGYAPPAGQQRPFAEAAAQGACVR